MRSLTVDECGVVSGGLVNSRGYTDPLDEGMSPASYVYQLTGNSNGYCTNSEGGPCVFVSTDENGIETVWVFGNSYAAVDAAICQVNFTLGLSVTGWAVGKFAGGALGGFVGGGVGFLAIPFGGPGAPVVGTAVGAALGSHHGGAAGAWAGGVAGGYVGAYVCNGG
jgi:hypothetical protein